MGGCILNLKIMKLLLAIVFGLLATLTMMFYLEHPLSVLVFLLFVACMVACLISHFKQLDHDLQDTKEEEQ